MAADSVQLVTLGYSSEDGEGKYEIYDAGSDMLCVIGSDNKQTSSKTPGLKPRYKQSYREAWESMRDFKDWLTSIPGNNMKAYCKLCKKELHCHRLSLLKHKVTYKHHKKEEEHKLNELFAEQNEKNSKNAIDKKNETPERNISDDESSLFQFEGKNNTNVNSTLAQTEKSECTDAMCHDNEEEAQTKDRSLSTHILDISKGVPAALVHIVLYKLIEGRWTLIHEGLTDTDGRYNYFSDEFSVGRYKLHFDIDKYFEKQNQETIFPFVEVAFDVKNIGSHYHIPLLLSPFGYSTYRGS